MDKETASELKFGATLYSTQVHRICRVITPPNKAFAGDSELTIELEVIAGKFFEAGDDKYEQKKKLKLNEVVGEFEDCQLLLSSEEFTPTQFAAFNMIMMQLTQTSSTVHQITQLINNANQGIR